MGVELAADIQKHPVCHIRDLFHPGFGAEGVHSVHAESQDAEAQKPRHVAVCHMHVHGALDQQRGGQLDRQSEGQQDAHGGQGLFIGQQAAVEPQKRYPFGYI